MERTKIIQKIKKLKEIYFFKISKIKIIKKIFHFFEKIDF